MYSLIMATLVTEICSCLWHLRMHVALTGRLFVCLFVINGNLTDLTTFWY